MFSFSGPPETKANKSWQAAALGSAILTVVSVFAKAPQAEAASMVMYSGDTTGGPTWNRPDQGVPPSGLSGIGTNVPFSVQEFSVDTHGFYLLFSESTTMSPLFFYNNFLVLYETSFSRLNPLTNVIGGASDDINSGFVFLGLPLTVGTPYFLVTSGFNNDDFGTFTNTITGPQGSHITLVSTPTPVPVPPAALGLLLTSVLSARKLHQQKQTVSVQHAAKV